jgi:arsenate reductase (glutaredoxin)
LLEREGISFSRRDFFRERLTFDELSGILNRVGLSPQDVLSTRSKAYAALGIADQTLSDDALLALMVEEPTLLRRPIVIVGHDAAVGFNERRILEIIENGTPKEG